MKVGDSIIKLLKEALEDPSLVQSFSGVRTSFGSGPEISNAQQALAIAYGFAYSKHALEGFKRGVLLIGRDPRPTGEAIASALIEGFLAGAISVGCRLKIINLDIITTPILETAVRVLKASGGVMITASHNPLNDNGFKFLTGVHMTDSKNAPPGALVSSHTMASIVQEVRRIANGDVSDFLLSVNKITKRSIAQVVVDDSVHRVKAERGYLDAIGKEWGITPHCLKPLTFGPALLDPNGGAACGIGARVLEHFGVRAIEENAEIGYPEHSIDTDGIDPASGRHMLLRISRAAQRNHARFGIAFDYDADRGNIVLPGYDESSIIHPQTVAAMNIALVLAHRETVGRQSGRLAVVISDATSGISEKVAQMFGAEIFKVETDEINVVTKMHQLRRDGYDVPVGVEGPNGGTIFGESTCRDGLQTALCAALGDEEPKLAEQLRLTLLQNGFKAPAGKLRLPGILAALPKHFNRMLRIEGSSSSPHGEIKARMEELFAQKVWPALSNKYRSYRFANFEGTEQVEKRTGDETGGWRIELEDGKERAFVFARGSRTESGVWRLIVDDPDATRGARLLSAASDLMRMAIAE